jgi:hypothetical protein
MAQDTGRYHVYHAEAGVLHASLQLPLAQVIKPQAFAKLPERGGYLSQHANNFRLEGVVSFRSAYTQVAGNPDVKPGHGFSTITTSVIEDLNVLDVVTADRVVAQISTEHPLVGYVPHITFLGTRFENLRIAGHKVELDLDCDFLGPRSGDDSPYTGNRDLLEKIAAQTRLAEGIEACPEDDIEGYYEDVRDTDDPDVENPEYAESLDASLVTNSGFAEDGDSQPGQCFNHVIDVPNFGKVYLAHLRVKHENFKKDTGIPKQTSVNLSMVKLKMGCIAAGTAAMVTTRTNGMTRP